MVSEPSSFDVAERGFPSHETADQLPVSKALLAEEPIPDAGIDPNPIPEPQPRWMSVTVVLAGVIGLVVMILLVRG
jgi:hypothetical protein